MELLLLNPYNNLAKKIFTAIYYKREKGHSDWSKLLQGDHRAGKQQDLKFNLFVLMLFSFA